jgi:glycosyltransferase involved in cell wall biosynthesis
MSVWLLVAGDFTPYGGMDAANFALASYLARRNSQDEVHLVSHRVSAELTALPSVREHRVPRPLGAERFGEPLIRLAARRWQRRLTSTSNGHSVRTIANGGNADAGDVNWVHYVHAAFRPEAAGAWNRLRVTSNHRRYLAQERAALARSKVIICNSRRTADDIVASVGVPRDRTSVVYYGVDARRFGCIDPAERETSRRALGLQADRKLALFVGALGDRRKGFDVLFEAWCVLCRRSDWDVDLIIAGVGAELPAWRSRAERELPDGRMRFLGFRRDMPSVLAACDLLIHPARYEAYGLAVHEAICRGLPAVVTADAGVAEQYPQDLECLLLRDPNSASELEARLLAWRGDSAITHRVAAFASRLRARSWDHMSRDIVDTVQGTKAS